MDLNRGRYLGGHQNELELIGLTEIAARPGGAQSGAEQAISGRFEPKRPQKAAFWWWYHGNSSIFDVID
jgi:hypothetical protein